jgi:hypothetical protein
MLNFGQTCAFATEIEILSENVKMYERPSTASKVLTVLKTGDRVPVTLSLEKGWFLTIFQKKTGYIQTKNYILLNGQSDNDRALGGEKENCNARTADVALNIDSAKLNCLEGVTMNSGYDSCSLYLTLGARTVCNKSMEAFVYCEVDFEYSQVGSGGTMFVETSSAKGNFQLHIDYGFGKSYEELVWKPLLSSYKTTSVKVKDLRCKINGLYD